LSGTDIFRRENGLAHIPKKYAEFLSWGIPLPEKHGRIYSTLANQEAQS
jgi:hypothetical protein